MLQSVRPVPLAVFLSAVTHELDPTFDNLIRDAAGG